MSVSKPLKSIRDPVGWKALGACFPGAGAVSEGCTHLGIATRLTLLVKQTFRLLGLLNASLFLEIRPKGQWKCAFHILLFFLS